MDWSFLQPLSFLVAIGVFIWYLRKDSKDDYLRLETKLEVWRKESLDIMREIKDEIKDFHGRLCAIEEKRRAKEK